MVDSIQGFKGGGSSMSIQDISIIQCGQYGKLFNLFSVLKRETSSVAVQESNLNFLALIEMFHMSFIGQTAV